MDTVRRVMGDAFPILVGGRPFNANPDLWERIGADAVSLDAADAVTVAERLTRDK